MKKFEPFTSLTVPLPLSDVDTDMIIPAQYLTSVSSEGYGEHLFQRLKESQSNFPFNQPRYQQAEIIVAGSNFGCGSSREHAVWALLGAGIRAIIAPSFADIFSSNSAKNGLLLIVLPQQIVEQLLDSAEAGPLTLSIDLQSELVTEADGSQHAFNYDPFRKHCLLEGLDDIDYILSRMEEVDTFKKKREEQLFLTI